MYSSVKTGEKRAPYLVELVADTDSDIADLETHYAPGSKCFVIASSNTYMLSHNQEWKLVEVSSGGSGGGATVEGSLATTEDIDNLFN